MSIKYANNARIMKYDFKKAWISWDTYSAFLCMIMLANDWDRILVRPGSDLCDWNGLRKPRTRKSDYNFSLKF